MISTAQWWELAGENGWEWREHLQKPFTGCLTPHNPHPMGLASKHEWMVPPCGTNRNHY